MSTSFVAALQTLSTTAVVGSVGIALLLAGAFGQGAFMTFIFYTLLTLFSVIVSYRLTMRRYVTLTTAAVVEETPALSPAHRSVMERPDLFPAVVMPPARAANVQHFNDPGVPDNLPVVGYADEAAAHVTEVAADAEAELARDLEAQAHQAHVLLSTDALRHFIATIPRGVSPEVLMKSVLLSAKQRYPSEDGWVVVSEARMREVCVECMAVPMAASDEAPYVPTVVPAGTGSLAEMVAAGNLSAAYGLIGHRPMFALADAVADFDALYRSRGGEDTNTSALLKEVTANISTDTIKAITVALTSALDGTYTDEAEAVKTAIMKAIKVRG